jgi:molybdate transport repressor ModE-like protein
MVSRKNTSPIPTDLPQALADASADKRLDVLRHVAAGCSISQAARQVGISYKAAWQAIDTLSNLSGVPLVERTVGGVGGGGARITSDGLQLLALAAELARAASRCWPALRVVPSARVAWAFAPACATSCAAACNAAPPWRRATRWWR